MAVTPARALAHSQFLAVGAVAVLGLAGCTAGGTAGDASSASVLSVAASAAVTTWDPVRSFSTEALYLGNVYEPLLWKNAEGADEEFARHRRVPGRRARTVSPGRSRSAKARRSTTASPSTRKPSRRASKPRRITPGPPSSGHRSSRSRPPMTRPSSCTSPTRRRWTSSRPPPTAPGSSRRRRSSIRRRRAVLRGRHRRRHRALHGQVVHPGREGRARGLRRLLERRGGTALRHRRHRDHARRGHRAADADLGRGRPRDEPAARERRHGGRRAGTEVRRRTRLQLPRVLQHHPAAAR